MKAFLSHSSTDKQIVGTVAKELTKLYCIYDTNDFENGVCFIQSMEESIEKTKIFVLFASKKSIESFYVRFEINEARRNTILNNISKTLIFIIDSDISYKDLPVWMQRAKIERQNSGKAIARIIKHELIKQRIAQSDTSVLIDRISQKNELSDMLTPFDSDKEISFANIYGLPGIGRKTFLKNECLSLTEMSRALFISIEDGDELQDIAFKIADTIEPYSTIEGLNSIKKEIYASTEEDILKRVSQNLLALRKNKELVCLIDAYGLLTEEGYLSPSVNKIIKHMTPEKDFNLFLVSTRKLYLDPSIAIANLKIEQLSEKDTKRLLAKLAKKKDLSISPSAIKELGDYIGGVPFVAKMAIDQAKEYGVDLLLKDKYNLITFKAQYYKNHLLRTDLSHDQKKLLKALATYNPLPLTVLADIVGDDNIGDAIIGLIDSAFIRIDDNFYYIADPISDAVHRFITLENPLDLNKIFVSLDTYISENKKDESKLALSRVLYRLQENEEVTTTSKNAISLTSDLVNLVALSYQNREFRKAIEYSLKVFEINNKVVSTHEYYIKALIQEERWEDAKVAITKLQTIAPTRDVFYLLGFLERKRGNLQDAINHYENSLEHKRKGAAIYRELALCHFGLHDLEKAQININSALQKTPDNKFCLDLAIKIAALAGEQKKAEQLLNDLKIVDDEPFYLHRLSTVNGIFGLHDDAYRHAHDALTKIARPSFGMIINLIDCCLKLNKLHDANELFKYLDAIYPAIRFNIRTTLFCKYLNKQGKFKACLNLLDKIDLTERRYTVILEKEALEGELSTSALTDDTIKQYKERLKIIDNSLNNEKDISTFLLKNY
ncbi:TIR domain-containing protein [Maridesulfovibrio sp. FT414]|uniref:TIR domain-containing protein n=1 Tax=Maridesulfovibrio sp. FT414 TaxID=2979469 RepID=UPI003D800712